MNNEKCSVEGCDNKAKHIGLCNAHYLRMWKYGSTDSKYTERNTMAICSVDGCVRKATEKGMCHMHRQRVLKFGDPNIKTMGRRYSENKINHRQRGTCGIIECNEPHYAHGYCHKHYMQLKRRGDIINEDIRK
jgi:hypothetical protein